MYVNVKKKVNHHFSGRCGEMAYMFLIYSIKFNMNAFQLFIIFGLRNGTDFNDCITLRYFVCGLAVRPNFRRQGLNAQNLYKDLGRCH